MRSFNSRKRIASASYNNSRPTSGRLDQPNRFRKNTQDAPFCATGNVAWETVFPSSGSMEVQFTPDVEKKLNDLAAQSGRGSASTLVQHVIEGYFDELAETREMLNSRYDDLKSGRVQPIDGEEFFESLRRREDELLKKHSPR